MAFSSAGLFPDSGDDDHIERLEGAIADVIQVCEEDLETAFLMEARNLLSRNGEDLIRVAVVGPFNRGKSTLLNALLSERLLHVDLIPATAVEIAVSFGETLACRVHWYSGEVQSEGGLSLLSRFSKLENGQAVDPTVKRIEVEIPSRLLAGGLQLVDLPGTDDDEGRNQRVIEGVMGCDLILLVLDARQLLTLGEKNMLEQLLERGVTSIAFVVNFMNLLEEEDRNSVWLSLQAGLGAYSARLALGLHYFRVDALPALRGKPPEAVVQLGELRDFLVKAGSMMKLEGRGIRRPRVIAFRSRLEAVLGNLIERREKELYRISEGRARRESEASSVLDRARAEFERGLGNLKKFLSEELLSTEEQGSLFALLSGGSGASFLKAIETRLEVEVSLINRGARIAGEEKKRKPPLLEIEIPQLFGVPRYRPPERDSQAERMFINDRLLRGCLIGCLCCGLFPLGAWISYLRARQELDAKYAQRVRQHEENVTEEGRRLLAQYLGQLSASAIATLNSYLSSIGNLFESIPTKSDSEVAVATRLEVLRDCLRRLEVSKGS